MVNDLLKNKILNLISKSKEKKQAKTYSEFCKTKEGEESSLSKDEIMYYTSLKKGELK